MSFGRRGATRASVFPTLTTKQAVRASRAWFSGTTTPTSPLPPQRQLACVAHARASRLHGFPPFILGTHCCASFRSSRPASAQAPCILRPSLGFPGGEESEGGEIKEPRERLRRTGEEGGKAGLPPTEAPRPSHTSWAGAPLRPRGARLPEEAARRPVSPSSGRAGVHGPRSRGSQRGKVSGDSEAEARPERRSELPR